MGLDLIKLTATLLEDLPGEAAQFRMAPMARKRISEMPLGDNSIRKAAVMIPLFKNLETLFFYFVTTSTVCFSFFFYSG